MYKVEDKTAYYFVDRNNNKTHYIGNFSSLITFLASRLNFEKRKIYIAQRLDKRDFVYDDWDFSGSDTHWVKEYKQVFGRYYDWKTKSFICGWHTSTISKLIPRPYMIINDCGDVIDFRCFEQEILAVPHYNTPWGTTKNAKHGEKFLCYRYSSESYRFRCGPVPGVHRYPGYSRRPHKGLLNTIRNADSIRPKARIDFDYWDNFAHTDKSWKTNSKCRYQWQKNLKG